MLTCAFRRLVVVTAGDDGGLLYSRAAALHYCYSNQQSHLPPGVFGRVSAATRARRGWQRPTKRTTGRQAPANEAGPRNERGKPSGRQQAWTQRVPHAPTRDDMKACPGAPPTRRDGGSPLQDNPAGRPSRPTRNAASTRGKANQHRAQPMPPIIQYPEVVKDHPPKTTRATTHATNQDPNEGEG